MKFFKSLLVVILIFTTVIITACESYAILEFNIDKKDKILVKLDTSSGYSFSTEESGFLVMKNSEIITTATFITSSSYNNNIARAESSGQLLQENSDKKLKFYKINDNGVKYIYYIETIDSSTTGIILSNNISQESATDVLNHLQFSLIFDESNSSKVTNNINNTETTFSTKETTNNSKLATSDVIRGDTTTERFPADLGTWVSYQHLNYSDMSSLFDVYIRINKITTYQDNKDYIETTIEEYNKSSAISNLSSENLPDGMHYAVADVDYIIPDQEAKVENCYGSPAPLTMNVITNSNISLNSNINYSNTYEVKDNTIKYNIGDSCHTKIIFAITDNLTDYYFKITYSDSNPGKNNEAYLSPTR